MTEEQTNQLIKLGVLGAGGFVAYKMLYLPWAFEQEVRRRTEEEARRLAAQGMSLTEATQQALAGACMGAAAVYKVPPSVSGGVCQGVGVLAQKGLELTAKGAVIAGKAIGSGIATGAEAVGSGVKTGVLAVGSGVKTGVLAVGSGVATGAKAVGTAGKFIGYTAPKAVITNTAQAAKAVIVDAPKAVVSTAASGVKAVGSAVVSLFGGGSSEVCRTDPKQPHGGKAVFPNDMHECNRRYGITDCRECGRKFDLKAMKWPWQINPQDGLTPAPAPAPAAPAVTPAVAAAVKKLVAIKPPGFRGLGAIAGTAERARRQLATAARPGPNPFAGRKVAPGRPRRSLAGLPEATRPRRVTGAEYYTRHLK